jgi:hypothetical protein
MGEEHTDARLLLRPSVARVYDLALESHRGASDLWVDQKGGSLLL